MPHSFHQCSSGILDVHHADAMLAETSDMVTSDLSLVREVIAEAKAE